MSSEISSVKEGFHSAVLRVLPHGSETDRKSELLLEYGQLLHKWNQKVNMVGSDSFEKIVDEHLYDSVLASRHLPSTGAVFDIGTGAGLPGIPIAILDPRRKVVLIEPREKCVAFLKEVRKTLHLANLEIRAERVEELSPQIIQEELGLREYFAVSRAFSPIESLIPCCRKLLRNGRKLFYLGGESTLPLRALDPAVAVIEQAVPYHPQHRAKRLYHIKFP